MGLLSKLAIGVLGRHGPRRITGPSASNREGEA